MKYTKKITHTLELDDLQFSILQDLLWNTRSEIRQVNDALVEMRDYFIPNNFQPKHSVEWDLQGEEIVIAEEKW